MDEQNDIPERAASGQPDPYGGQGEPYGGQADPYGGQRPYTEPADPYEGRTDPPDPQQERDQTDPYGIWAAGYARQQDRPGEQADPYGGQPYPYGQQPYTAQPYSYGQQPNPYGDTPAPGPQAYPYGRPGEPYAGQGDPYRAHGDSYGQPGGSYPGQPESGRGQDDPYRGQDDPYRGQDDPYRGGADPYGQRGAPYRQQGDRYGQRSDPHGQQREPYGQQGDPYRAQGDPYRSGAGSYGQQDDRYRGQADPYGQQDDPYGQYVPYAAAQAGGGAGGEQPRHRRGKKALAIAGAAGLLAGGLGAGLWVGNFASSNNTASAPIVRIPSGSSKDSSESASTIAAQVSRGVVDINTRVSSPAGDGQFAAAGTGMILTSTGEVLTNNHVVKYATSIRVRIQGKGRSYPAKVLGVDPESDIALLQIEGLGSRHLTTVRPGNSSDAAVGEPVIALGNALGEGGAPHVVQGTVTALHQTETASDQSVTFSTETLHGLIETNADIVSGDSGGPLVNSSGEVIGMDTMASTGNGDGTVGFAIPIDKAIGIANQIAEGARGGGIILGESAYLGIFENADASGGVAGVFVSDVSAGGPAQMAGLTYGDTITAVNSHAVTTIAGLMRVISSLQPGARVEVSYVDQSGVAHTALITLAGIPE
jgi:S1-C subfamily serine protease